jgi:hypothetical protein
VRGRLLIGLITAAIIVAVVGGWALPARAGGISSQYKTARASEAQGQIVLHARYAVRTDATPASAGTGSSSAGSSNEPICTYMPLGPRGTKLLGKGGAEPGEWYIPGCKWPDGYVGDPMPAVWIVGQPPAPPESPTYLAQQAVADLPLGSRQIGMSPPPNRPQIVNVSTWLWIVGTWRGRTATADAGPVAATATAVPDKVVWSMGDGHVVTCYGPGTPYNDNEPSSDQSTSCSYTYASPSSAAPDGRYTVTATIYYRVSWVARGAPGGGNLGLVAGATARTIVRVEQAEALNTSGG